MSSEEVDVTGEAECAPNTYKNSHLSVSRIACRENCGEVFRQRYVLKNRPTGDGRIPADFGNVCHETLENIYKPLVMVGGNVELGSLSRLFRESFFRWHLTGNDLFQDGLTLLRKYLATRMSFSAGELLAVEHPFEIQLGRFKIVGKIDQVRCNEERKKITVVDYKSNWQLFTDDELAHDLQMGIYGIVVHKYWPGYEIDYEFHMLRHNVVQQTTRTRDDLKIAAHYIVGMGEKIESPDEKFEPRVQSNCQYCEYASGCEAYQKALLEEPHKVVTDGSLEQTLDKRDKVALLANLLYAERRKLDDKLLPLLRGREVEAGDNVYYVQQRTVTAYPAEAAIGIFCEHTGMSSAQVRNRIMKISTDKVALLLSDVAQDLGHKKAKIVEAELSTIAEMEPQTAQISKRKKAKRKLKKKETA